MDQQGGSGNWQYYSEENIQKLRPPRNAAGTAPNANANVNVGASGSAGLSVNAPEFIPKRPASHQPQQQQQYGMHNPHHQHQQHHHRYRGGDNNSGGGGGGGGGLGGNGSYGMGQMYQQHHQQQQHHHHNSGMVNGTDMPGKSKIAGRLMNHSQVPQQQQAQQQQLGHHGYENKDMRNASHYNHHPAQHYGQHSQQQRLQHHQQQQPSVPPHLSMSQNAGGHFPFAMAGMGYSTTALNNHLHHPILGGMAAAAAAGASGSGMMPHDNRSNKNNSSVRSRLQNAQNSQMHHLPQNQHQHQQHHLQQQPQHHQQMSHRAIAGSLDYDSQEPEEQITEAEMAALGYLMEVISELSDNPGMFENIQRKLKGTFVEFHANQYVMCNAVEMICEQSVKEQNFRYMGARLFQLLDSLDEGQDSVLWRLMRMKLEHQESELVSFMQNEQVRVRGTTLFLAELYMQLRKPQHDQRNNELAFRILGAVKILLSKEGPENIKCVCQCFKLCGYELERDRQHDLMEILETLANLETLTDNSTGRFIRSVLDLQQRSWGRNEDVAPAAAVQPSFGAEGTSNDFSDSPVFYGPDGQVMTEEENNFLETAAPAAVVEEFDNDSDPDELVDDDNMDMEIKMAFKDFLASSKNNRQPPY